MGTKGRIKFFVELVSFIHGLFESVDRFCAKSWLYFFSYVRHGLFFEITVKSGLQFEIVRPIRTVFSTIFIIRITSVIVKLRENGQNYAHLDFRLYLKKKPLKSTARSDRLWRHGNVRGWLGVKY